MEVEWVLGGSVQKVCRLYQLGTKRIESNIRSLQMPVVSLRKTSILPPDGVVEGMVTDGLLNVSSEDLDTRKCSLKRINPLVRGLASGHFNIDVERVEAVARVAGQSSSPEMVLDGVVAGVEHLGVLGVTEHDEALEEDFVEAVDTCSKTRHLPIPLSSLDVHHIPQKTSFTIAPLKQRSGGTTSYNLVNWIS